MKKVATRRSAGARRFYSAGRQDLYHRETTIQEYFPKINTLQIFDLDKHGEQLDKFFMIGFGTSGTELAARLRRDVLGSEQVKEQTAIRLRLIPKSGEDETVRSESWNYGFPSKAIRIRCARRFSSHPAKYTC